MGKTYIVVADSGRLFRLAQDSREWEWEVFDDGAFEPYELQMDIVYGNARLNAPKVGAQLIATFPGENRMSQGRIVEVFKRA